jgi:hypothetical protein
MIDRLITFSEFDVFAYLVVGLVLLAVCDLIFQTRLILRTEWGFGAGLMIVVTAYVLGHLVAIPGHWLIEEGIAKRLFERPQTILLSDDQYQTRCVVKLPPPTQTSLAQPPAEVLPTWPQATIFAHSEPLSCPVLAGLKAKLDKIAPDAKHGPELHQNTELLLAKGFLAARADKYALERMQIFLRLYSFSRNMACVLLFGALTTFVLLLPPVKRRWQAARHSALENYRRELSKLGASDLRRKMDQAEARLTIPDWMTSHVTLFVLFSVFGLGLLFRHMMFLELYTAEALTAYATAWRP